MKTLPQSDVFKELSKRVIWFEEPIQALSDPVRFTAYVMTYGTYEDMKLLRQEMSDEELINALDNAPPGIFDGRSWGYWNIKLGRYPAARRFQRELSNREQHGFSFQNL